MTLYITKEEALAAGLTHEGYAYGLPAWFDAGMETGSHFALVHKCPWMSWWGHLCQHALECIVTVTGVLFGNYELELVSPIRITGPIQ